MTSHIVTAPSSATAPPETAGAVLISGSYGGPYNAWHAVKKGARAVILNDAGVGLNRAGISGLDWLDGLGIPGATADCMSCHIGDGDHALAHGRISFANATALALGCRVGDTVRAATETLRTTPHRDIAPPPIEGGKRFVISEASVQRRVLGLDAAPLLEPSDAGAIAITGSHAALFRGRPDNVISVALFAAFFNDAGVGLDNAGIARLADLDGRAMIAATVSAQSAEIGHARSSYATGVVSFVNETGRRAGLEPGQKLSDSIARLAVM